MSKTLFNTNTFQSKNVRNSDDVGTLKVDTFKATNAILTNITNAELQAATAGVATNASAISTNATNISNNTTAISTNATNISNNTTAISANTTAISGKQDALSTGDGIDITGTEISFDGTLSQDVTTSGFIRAGQLQYLDSGVTTDVQTKIDNNASAISGKQDILTEGNGIDITGTTISFEGTSVTGDITTTGTITGATMNYVDGGVVTNIQTEIESKQDILTQADNAGTNITISASGVISATSGGTYTAETNGGLAVNASNEFSLDLTNSSSRFEFPQRIRIENDTTPQLLIEPVSNSGNDAEIEVRGARNGSTTGFHARILFSNYDADLAGTKNMGMIAGRVLDAVLNLGGLGFYYYPLSQTQTQGAFLSGAGNWTFGTSIQNNYKVEIDGDANITGSLYRVPQQIFYNFNIASMTGSTYSGGGNRFGLSGYFNSVSSTRTLGSTFCSISNGTITFSENGFYKIRVAANNQNLTYNDRTAFGVYLNINGTEYWEDRDYNFFGWTYTRNTSDGAHGNITFEDCIYIANTQTLQVRTKLDTDNRNFDNSLAVTDMNCYCNLQIERITETSI